MKLQLAFASALLLASTAHADEPENWNIKLQTTYIRQAQASFSSPYQGEHSLTPDSAYSYSWTATAALGLRLAPQTELYVNPEVAQGVPLSNLQGLGGFTNGEMARTSGSSPKLYRARVFVRQVIGLSEDTTPVESGVNQLAGNLANERVVITAGNLSVLDIFDANAYSHDPRSQFMNWTLMTHGAYDYAADSRGYTWGLAAEYTRGDWSWRAGRFIQPKEPNQLKLDRQMVRHHGDQVEIEHRHELDGGLPGAVRVLAFKNRARMSRYDDALDLAAQTGQAMDLNAVRTGDHDKVGLGVNLEQKLTRDVGLFARAMWADGKTETYAFTEVDRSVSGGVSIDGTRWGRAEDTLGLALARNALSSSHQKVLAAGGLTFFLGDGALRYRSEQVFEAYYRARITKGLELSADHQRIWNPGYNADRGPVSFWALRVHAEY